MQLLYSKSNFLSASQMSFIVHRESENKMSIETLTQIDSGEVFGIAQEKMCKVIVMQSKEIKVS